MFKRLRQAWRDHEAMNHVRSCNGDVNPIFVVVGGDIGQRPTYGHECNLFQGRARHFDVDPATAIIGAFATLRAAAVTDRAGGPIMEPETEDAILRLTDEEAEREIDLAFDRSSKAMQQAVEMGHYAPRKISAAVREYRRRKGADRAGGGTTDA